MENQNNISGQQTINIQVPSADNIASRRSLIPVFFAAVIIFFFFNFFTVSCGGQKVGSVTGIKLVTGTELKGQDILSGNDTKGEKIPANLWAIIAFGAAILGLSVFLIKEKKEAMIGTGAAVIGFISLVILQFSISNSIEEKSAGAVVEINFQFAYWLALMSMGIAGIISSLRMRQTNNAIGNFFQTSQTKQATITNKVENPSSHVKIALNHGLLIGIVLIFYSLLLWVIDVDRENGIQYYSYLFMLVGLILAIRHYIENHKDRLSYGKLFSNGFLTLFFAGILTSIYIFIFFQFIAPVEIEKMMEIAEEKIIESNSNLTDDQLEQTMSFSKIFLKPWFISIMAFAANVIVSLIIAAIVAFVMKEEEEHQFV